MSQFQVHLRQLKKNTRNRISEVGTRISTEISEEAFLMQKRASRISVQASKMSSRASHGISYRGDVPPPPPYPDLEASNPMYSFSETSAAASSIKPNELSNNINNATDKLINSKSNNNSNSNKNKSTNSININSKKINNGGAPRLSPSTTKTTTNTSSDISWLISKARKASLRFSLRELHSDHNTTSRPELFSAPLTNIWEEATSSSSSNKESKESTIIDNPETYQERAKQNPLLAALLSVPASEKIKLNDRFEEYRIREFRWYQFEPHTTPSFATAIELKQSPRKTIRKYKIKLNEQFEEYRIREFRRLQNNNYNAPSNKNVSTISMKFNKPTTSSTVTTTTYTSKTSIIKPKRIPLNQDFERYRIREFRRVQQEQKQAQDHKSTLVKPLNSKTVSIRAPFKIKLNSDFDGYRMREFIRYQQDAKQKQLDEEAKEIQQKQESASATVSWNANNYKNPQQRPDSSNINRSAFLIPPPTNQNPQIIKRSSGMKLQPMKMQEMPIIDEDNMSDHQVTNAFDPDSQRIPDRADIKTESTSSSSSDVSSTNGSFSSQKRGSIVSRAFKVLSASFKVNQVQQNPNLKLPPPNFPFNEFELLQLDMQRAEQQLNFRTYTQLETVFETNREHTDSIASAAALEFDRQRKAMQKATL